MWKSITGDVNTVGQTIYNLTSRFGLINTIRAIREENMFEMYDAIKNTPRLEVLSRYFLYLPMV